MKCYYYSSMWQRRKGLEGCEELCLSHSRIPVTIFTDRISGAFWQGVGGVTVHCLPWRKSQGNTGYSQQLWAHCCLGWAGVWLFIVAVSFLGREVSSWFPIVHINVAVLLLVYFFFFYQKSGPPGNRLNMSCRLPSSLRGCHQCNQRTGG